MGFGQTKIGSPRPISMGMDDAMFHCTCDDQGETRMFELLKAVHLLCLLLGGAASVGNAVLFAQVRASGAPPPPVVAGAMQTLGNLGLVAIVVLWASGVPLAVMTGAFVTGGPLFGLKLLAATAVLILVPAMTLLRRQVAQGKRPPNPLLMGRLAMIVRWLVVAAVVLAAVVFN